MKMIKREPIAKARSLIIWVFFDNNIFFLKNLPTFYIQSPRNVYFFREGEGGGFADPPPFIL